MKKNGKCENLKQYGTLLTQRQSLPDCSPLCITCLCCLSGCHKYFAIWQGKTLGINLTHCVGQALCKVSPGAKTLTIWNFGKFRQIGSTAHCRPHEKKWLLAGLSLPFGSSLAYLPSAGKKFEAALEGTPIDSYSTYYTRLRAAALGWSGEDQKSVLKAF